MPRHTHVTPHTKREPDPKKTSFELVIDPCVKFQVEFNKNIASSITRLQSNEKWFLRRTSISYGS